jgi:hypothetical protein
MSVRVLQSSPNDTGSTPNIIESITKPMSFGTRSTLRVPQMTLGVDRVRLGLIESHWGVYTPQDPHCGVGSPE